MLITNESLGVKKNQNRKRTGAQASNPPKSRDSKHTKRSWLSLDRGGLRETLYHYISFICSLTLLWQRFLLSALLIRISGLSGNLSFSKLCLFFSKFFYQGFCSKSVEDKFFFQFFYTTKASTHLVSIVYQINFNFQFFPQFTRTYFTPFSFCFFV